MKYSKNTKKRKQYGLVYLLKLNMRGQIVYKIGYTSRRIYQRVAELTIDVYKKMGYFPSVEVLRTDKTRFHVEMERELLEQTKQWQYTSDIQIEGITEYRTGCDENQLIQMYIELSTRQVWPEHNAKPLPPPPQSINDMDPISY